MDVKPTHAFKKGVKKNGRENQAGDYEATSLAFNRLGVILNEIAGDSVSKSDSVQAEEGGDEKCNVSDLPVVSKSTRKKNKGEE